MSVSQAEADAATLVQRFVSYFMNVGALAAGPDFLLLSVERLAEDLCQYCDIFEETDPVVLQPYIAVWREQYKPPDLSLQKVTYKDGEPVD